LLQALELRGEGADLMEGAPGTLSGKLQLLGGTPGSDLGEGCVKLEAAIGRQIPVNTDEDNTFGLQAIASSTITDLACPDRSVEDSLTRLFPCTPTTS
jgi:hypothetical protein